MTGTGGGASRARVQDDTSSLLKSGDETIQGVSFAQAEDSGVHYRLAQSRQMHGDHDAAITHYNRALTINPSFEDARRNLAKLLVAIGRSKESYPLWRAELSAGSAWFEEVITNEMKARDLRMAGEYASILAALRWGSRWYPSDRENGFLPPPPEWTPSRRLAVSKLIHDIEQFRYLQGRGILGGEFNPIIDKYQRLVNRLTARGTDSTAPLDELTHSDIGDVYSRIVHIRSTPRLARALSARWNPAAIEKAYIDTPPGVVVVDDFLTPEALKSLQQFCLESTIWSTVKPQGRLGSLFRDGFACPLLLQIAEDLRRTLPRLIGDRHPLRHMWGYKSPGSLPGDSITHADFAAVNVNFWITPEDANLDKTSGGLIIYNVDAPMHWDFHTYNARLDDVIRPYLRQNQAQAVTIPYRENRAVIFNSDLFHSTDEVCFREGYQNRRINITMLYGLRRDDLHHRGLKGPAIHTAGEKYAWRSDAFSRARRGLF